MRGRRIATAVVPAGVGGESFQRGWVVPSTNPDSPLFLRGVNSSERLVENLNQQVDHLVW